MAFAWNNDLATGIADIDDQHKELFSRINNLLQACALHKDRVQIDGVLIYLRDYVAFHFAAEERDMTGYGYPEMPVHLDEHKEFQQTIQHLLEQFREQGATLDVVEKTVWSAGEWFLKHIYKSDMKLAAFLKRAKS